MSTAVSQSPNLRSLPGTPVADSQLVQDNATLRARAPELVDAFGQESVGQLRAHFGGLKLSDIGLLRKAERAALLGALVGGSQEPIASRGVLAGYLFGKRDADAVRNETIAGLQGIAKEVKREMAKSHVSGGNDLQDPRAWLGRQVAVDALADAERLAKLKASPTRIEATALAAQIIHSERLAAYRAHQPMPTFDAARFPEAEVAALTTAQPVPSAIAVQSEPAAAPQRPRAKTGWDNLVELLDGLYASAQRFFSRLF